MEKNLFYTSYQNNIKNIWLLPGVLIAIFFGWLIAGKGMAIGVLLIFMPFVAGFLVLVFLKKPYMM